MCGLLHCKHQNEKLEFGIEYVSIIDKKFILVGKDNAVAPCRFAQVDMGLGSKDPGMVPDGVKCGDGKVSGIITVISASSILTMNG